MVGLEEPKTDFSDSTTTSSSREGAGVGVDELVGLGDISS